MKQPETFTSPIGPLITRYLAVKRALGRHAVSMAYILGYLDRFLVSCHGADLTRETFNTWGESMASLHATTRRARTPNRVSLLPLPPPRASPQLCARSNAVSGSGPSTLALYLFRSRHRPPACRSGRFGTAQSVTLTPRSSPSQHRRPVHGGPPWWRTGAPRPQRLRGNQSSPPSAPDQLRQIAPPALVG